MRNPISKVLHRIEELKNSRNRAESELEKHRDSCPMCHGLTHNTLVSGNGCEVGINLAIKVDIENINLKWAA